MKRETLTLWWLGQGLFILLVSGYYGYWNVGAVTLFFHIIAAICSWFFYEED